MKTALISLIFASLFLTSCATIPDSESNPGAVNTRKSGKLVHN